MPRTMEGLTVYEMETLDVLVSNYSKTAKGLYKAQCAFVAGDVETGIEYLKSVGFANFFGMEG